jgi:hypothetical protein
MIKYDGPPKSLDFRCPYCLAPKSKNCTTPNGNEREPHFMRFSAAEEAREKWFKLVKHD